MQLNLFNGGLNTRLQPHLIGASEAVMCHNVDTTSGVLAPLKETKDLQAEVKPNFYKFNNHFVSSDDNRDYVEFQGKLYYSDGTKIPQWSKDGFEWFQLGIDAPKDKPLVTGFESQTDIEVETLSEVIDYFKFCICTTSDFNMFNDPTGVVKKFWDTTFPAGKYRIGLRFPTPIIKDVESDELNFSYYEWDIEFSTNWFLYLDSFYYTDEISDLSNYSVYIQQYGVDNKMFAYNYNVFGQTRELPSPEILITVGWRKVGNTSIEKPDDLINTFEDKNITFVMFEEQSSGAKFSSKDTLFTLDSSLTREGESGIKLGDIYRQKFNVCSGYKFSPKDTLTNLIVFSNNRRCKLLTNDSTPNVWYYKGEQDKQTLDEFIKGEGGEAIEYAYSYVNYDNEESILSPINVFPIKLFPCNVKVEKSLDPQIKYIRIYRRGNGLTQFSLVAEIQNNTQTYFDELGNTEIDGAVYDSYNNTPAPQGLRYLTVSNVMMFGTLNDKLYYTEVAKPYVWDRLNFIDFEEEITGIGDTPNGLLVFTKHKTYIVTGTSPTTFSKYLLSAGVGCILHKSVQTLANTLIWLSAEGLCASNGGAVQILTRDKLNTLRLNTPRCSAVLDDVYYLSHLNGTFIADFRFGLVFREMSGVFLGLCSSDDKLYGVEQGDKLVELFGSENNTTLHYISPNYPDGSMSNIKIYKNIYTYSSGQVELIIRVDDKIVLTQQLDEGFTELKVPAQTKGYFINFEVKGTGTLKEIEYKFEGRQNGR